MKSKVFSVPMQHGMGLINNKQLEMVTVGQHVPPFIHCQNRLGWSKQELKTTIYNVTVLALISANMLGSKVTRFQIITLLSHYRNWWWNDQNTALSPVYYHPHWLKTWITNVSTATCFNWQKRILIFSTSV